MSCPRPESLLSHAIGVDEPATARHVEGCSTCRAEVAQLREVAGLLRGQASMEDRTATPDCLDELVIADFLDGRLGPEVRAPIVEHLVTCARCRSLVRAAGRLLSDAAVTVEMPGATSSPADRRWRRWSVPIGVAAAATVVLFLWPGIDAENDSIPRLREPTITSTVAPLPIAPRASVSRVDRLAWSGVPGAEQYRLRLYDDEGSVLWMVETPDTAVALPNSILLSPGATYFWRVEAQTEWRRWAASDLVEFRLVGRER